MPELLREDDRAVLGDQGYVNNQYKRRAREAGVFWGVLAQGEPGSGAEWDAQALQPQDVVGSGAGRTHISGDQAAVWLYEGALQGAREERRAGIRADRAEQSVPGEEETHGHVGRSAPLAPGMGRKEAERPQQGAVMNAI